MPRKSKWTVPVPEVSLVTYTLGPAGASLGKHENELAYADADKPDTHFLTWGSFRLWSQRFAVGLIAAGLKPGDRVVTFTPNDVFYPVLYMGICMAGGRFSPANARFLPSELAYQLKVVGAKFVLASDENVAGAVEAAGIVGLGKESIFVFNDAPLEKDGGGADDVERGVRHWKHLLVSKEEGAKFVWDDLKGEAAKSTTSALVMSSGTTGLPKAVDISHYALVANNAQTDYVMNLDPNLATRELSSRNSRWLCCIPMYHGLGLVYFTQISALRRVPTYIMRQFDLNRMLDHIQRFKITELHLVPPILIGMTKHPRVRSGKYDISTVTKTFSCAAPLGPEPTRQYEALWPKGVMNVKQGLASSESACSTIGWDPTVEAVPGSVGELMPNCEMKLVDDDGVEVPQGQPGEIWVRSPNVMSQYWENPKATAESLTKDGWLVTGDVATVDANGYYYVVDRKKEMIKVKGVQVAPAELEAILLDHPKVLDAAVIGIKKGEDEAPRAYIVPDPSTTLTDREVMEYMDGKVSTIKKLTGGIVFTDVIPKAPSGKILRRILREKAAKESKTSKL
ncbi:putative 4-coumarate-CoA ligase [Coniochaeta sp. 2T2.1]|nr:putative 4-coumarate-CoA ligase [Coniochaeta sp. 2T2.1]